MLPAIDAAAAESHALDPLGRLAVGIPRDVDLRPRLTVLVGVGHGGEERRGRRSDARRLPSSFSTECSATMTDLRSSAGILVRFGIAGLPWNGEPGVVRPAS